MVSSHFSEFEASPLHKCTDDMCVVTDLNLHCMATKMNSNINKRRWRLALNAISSIRAFSLLNRPSKPENYLEINQSSLTQLVKERNLHLLDKLGGIKTVVSALETNVELGIQDDHADGISGRQKTFGMNTYAKLPAKSFSSFLVKSLKDSIVLIDIFGVILSLFFGMKKDGPKEGWYEGGSIVLAVFLVITVSAISDFRQSRQLEKLSEISNNIQVNVVRNGRYQLVSIFDVVVGDITLLNIGDQVPADGLFVSGHLLQIDESCMTGESGHVDINHDKNPFLFAGTKVADGYARMLIISVGMNTTWGEMMSSISQISSSDTPLHARLNRLTSSIGKISLRVAFIVHVVLLLRFFTGHTKDDNGKTEFKGSNTKVVDVIDGVLETLVAAISIVFVTIPEGFPLAVTLVLAYSMKRMMADQAMVRKLSAFETMGTATTICTDKTGTLTMNKMMVTKFCLGQEFIEESNLSSIDPTVLGLIHQGAGLNTTGGVYKPSSGSEMEFSGSPTEMAILSWAVLELKMDMEKFKKSSELLNVEAFNPEKRRSGILMKIVDNNTRHVHWKGAAEMIIAMCTDYYDSHGKVKALDDYEREKFNQLVQGMAAGSLRCIAFAHKQLSKLEFVDRNATVKDDNLILLGVVGIKNPCRPEVWKAVQDCQLAGINVKMITGDNVFTAKAIATECGILKFNQDMDSKDIYSGLVVEGVEFRNSTVEKRMEIVEKISVMARASPFDKLLMVQCLKQKGHIVAVTGARTNDAAALKEADIGLSMGITGTEVAKESSDIITLDDNFATVVTVVRWGRCVYKNIQKFIQFQLTVNVAALVINFVAAVSTGEVPLTAVKLVWINLIMDTLGALALATEEPTKALMEKRPVGHTEPLISNVMWRNLIAQALYQIIILLSLHFRGESIFDTTKKVKDTLIFNTFVLCQVCNAFNARKLEKKNVFVGIHKNKLFLGIIGITISLQVLMINYLGKFADTERLSWGQWGACIVIAVVSWPIGFVVKFILV